MSKQSTEEKERLVALMKELRERSNIKIPKLIEILNGKLEHPLKKYLLQNVLQNDFFGHPERSSSYNQELVMMVIAAYYKNDSDEDEEEQSVCNGQESITLIEAVLVLSWTHCSLAAYGELRKIFEIDDIDIYIHKMVNFIIDCEAYQLFKEMDWRTIRNYCDVVFDDDSPRPWDSLES